MGGRSRTELAAWALVVVLVGFLLQHFVVVHGAGPHARAGAAPATPSTPSDDRLFGDGWRPSVDTAALRALRLPVAAPVRFSNAGIESRVSVQYFGHLRLSGEGLALDLDIVYFQPGAEFESLVRLDSISFALAEPAPSGWRIWKAGPALATHPSGPSMPTHLEIEGVRAEDLPGRWPMVVHTVRVEEWTTGEAVRMRIPVSGDADAFDRLLAGRPWEGRR